MKILSWNVNGIRAADKKGLFDRFKKETPDILCLQEIKATPEQVPLYLRNPLGYYTFWKGKNSPLTNDTKCAGMQILITMSSVSVKINN